jgi:hypothetical protein
MNKEFITLHFCIEVRGFRCSENHNTLTLSCYVPQENAEISFVSLRYGTLHILFFHFRLTFICPQVVQVPAHHIGSTNTP